MTTAPIHKRTSSLVKDQDKNRYFWFVPTPSDSIQGVHTLNSEIDISLVEGGKDERWAGKGGMTYLQGVKINS